MSLSEQVRPLLSPGDVRELGADEQLVFVTGHRPMRVRKLRYYADPRLAARVLPPPDPAAEPDRPGGNGSVAGNWAGEREKVAAVPAGLTAAQVRSPVKTAVAATTGIPAPTAPPQLELDDDDELTDV